MKTHVPFNTTRFEVITLDLSIERVQSEYRNQIEWLKTQQEYYYKHELNNVVENIIQNSEPIKGSVNSYGRKLGLTPHQDYHNQPYNMAEMYRASIISGTAGYLQDTMIAELIKDENTTAESILKEWPTEFKKPKKYHTENVIDRVRKTGVISGVPRSKGFLPLWACDTHHTKITQNGREVFLTTKHPYGLVTLKFTLPKGERFSKGKVTRPTVGLNHKNQIIFFFTLQQEVEPAALVKPVLGVDLGKNIPFVGTVVDGEGHYSAPILPSHKINTLTKKLDRLYFHKEYLFKKFTHEDHIGHDRKAEILRTEYLRVRSKISRLKVEQSHNIANQILDVAESLGASVMFEELGWVQAKGGKWDHARTQTATEHKAVRRGVRVRKTNAKNTSRTCSKCGSLNVSINGNRHVICADCRASIDRDITASRNIAYRAFGKKLKVSFLKQLSVQTRVSRRSSSVSISNKLCKNSNLYNKLL